MGRRTLVLAALLLVVAAFASAGCGERLEPLGELPSAYPVTERGAGDQPVVVKARPERIVALDPGSTELLLRLGVGGRLLGTPAEAPWRNALKVVRLTGQIDVAAVARLRPDLVVATPSTDRVDLSRIERETGATIYVQPASTIEEIERAARELGFIVGEPVEARRLVAKLKRAAAAVDERLRSAPDVTVFIDTGFFITVPERSLLGELVRRAHGKNVAADNAGLGPFDLAQLRRLDPTVYLATSDSKTTLETLRKNPKTRALAAVREGHVIVLPAGLLSRAGPRIAKAYADVARALHPDAFR